ncbi:hypothetical protein AAMO2058_001414800 [Amorphochlora amoebiformis]
MQTSNDAKDAEMQEIHRPLLRKKNANDAKSEKPSRKKSTGGMASDGHSAGDFLELFPNWAAIAGPFFCKSQIRGRAWFLIVLTVILVLLQVGVIVAFSYVQRDYNTALQKKDSDAFYLNICIFVVLIMIACPLFTIGTYVEGYVALIWREWLTKQYLGMYFKNRSYYHLKNHHEIDNPDQRITEDVKNFVDTSVKMITLVVKAIAYISAFTGVLVGISYTLVFFLLLYSTFGTVIAVWGFGRRLMELQRTALAREATFRFSLVRVRENAESVAFYNGGSREHRSSGTLFGDLVITLLSQLKWLAGLQLFNSFFQYITFMLPPLLIAPLYFSGEVEFGVIPQAAMAFSTIRHNLSLLANNLATFASLGAEAARLIRLRDAMCKNDDPIDERIGRVSLQSPDDDDDKSKPSKSLVSKEESESKKTREAFLVVNNLTLNTPDGRRELVRELNLQLGPGESLLIIGPSGCGKSSLLRCFAGLWGRGKGEISMIQGGGGVINATDTSNAAECDNGHSSTRAQHTDIDSGSDAKGEKSTTKQAGRIIFLPQKPYMALFGSLREQMLFPLPAQPKTHAAPVDTDSQTNASSNKGGKYGGVAGSNESKVGDDIPPEKFREALKTAALGELAYRFSLDDKIAWEDVLSLGQQQRLTLARLFLRENVSIAFLDEATSACDSITEKAVYEAIQKHVPCYISIAHRVRSLLKFHTHVLKCEISPHGAVKWLFMTSEDFRKQQALIPQSNDDL